LQQNLVGNAFGDFLHNLFISAFSALIVYFGVTQIFTRFFINKGDRHTDDQIVGGTRLASSIKETIKSVEQSSVGASEIKIANQVPIPRFSEFQGVLFHGSIGSGKSQGIMRLLDEIRATGDAALIYDKECTLKPFFFDKTIDSELNPLSTDCEHWDQWEECENPIEMAALATYLMPKSVQGSDPFWVDAARTIFSTVTWEMRDHEDREVIKQLQVLLTTTLDELRGILKGTEAENLVSKDIEKTAISIRAVMATYTKALRFLEGLSKDKSKKPFAIKKWIRQQFDSTAARKGWLFITSRANIHAEIKPLLTAWIGMALKGIQSLPPNSGKRFWIILDEMASLNRLEGFSDIAADIRKFGGCIAIGIQSVSQIEYIYGDKEGTAITDLLNTSLYYRSPKQRVAEWVSKDLGEQVVEEVRESQSYGPNAIRDGNTIGRQRVTRRTVEASDIMQLEDLNFYLRLVGNHPITKIHSPYVKGRQQTIEHALVERKIDWDAIKKIADVAEEIENNPECDDSIKASKKQNSDSQQTDSEEKKVISSHPNDQHEQETNAVVATKNDQVKTRSSI
ncbi:type IV conjugative transfer system coupling protein TraD, partial [Piscirickettsia salmonis]|uniref:type IV conjugative transfer system coupling protein TraD n=1 Tax=Piscirickettsia salmonis TaxID=1238 RepID=UPI003EB83FAE